MNILAVGAHPDDVEFQCSGTLARLARLGHSISVLSVSNGQWGALDMLPAELAQLRLKEAANAAAVIGGRFHWGGMRDKAIFFDEQQRNRICEIIRRVRPDVLFAPSPQDYILDHEFSSLLTRDAATAAKVRHFETGELDPAPPTDKIPYFYYCEPLDRTDIFGNPVLSTTYVDITDVIDTKERILACHESQREFMRKHVGMDDFVERMKKWAAAAGEECGFTYAEGFRQHVAMPFPRENILVQLLGAKHLPAPGRVPPSNHRTV